MEAQQATVSAANQWECEHQQTEVRMRKVAGGSLQCVRQCLDCGKPIGSAIKRTQAYRENGGRQPAMFDEVLAKSWTRAREKAFASSREQKEREFWAWYGDYLASPEWMEKRAAVLDRDQHTCQGCRASEATQVHHLTYAHVGDELLFELVAICDDCHARAHEGRS